MAMEGLLDLLDAYVEGYDPFGTGGFLVVQLSAVFDEDDPVSVFAHYVAGLRREGDETPLWVLNPFWFQLLGAREPTIILYKKTHRFTPISLCLARL